MINQNGRMQLQQASRKQQIRHVVNHNEVLSDILEAESERQNAVKPVPGLTT